MNKPTFVTRNIVEKKLGGLPRRCDAMKRIDPDAYLMLGKKPVALFEITRAKSLTRALMKKEPTR
jgi:hypothetical protein